jgi:hypothetical protein
MQVRVASASAAINEDIARYRPGAVTISQELRMNRLISTGLCILIALGFAMNFGTSAKNPGDQNFLNAIIVLLALFGGLMIRMLFTLLKWHGVAWLVGKILAILALLFVCAALTVCSSMITSPVHF